MKRHVNKHHKQKYKVFIMLRFYILKCNDETCSETFINESLRDRHFYRFHNGVKPLKLIFLLLLCF